MLLPLIDVLLIGLFYSSVRIVINLYVFIHLRCKSYMVEERSSKVSALAH